MLKKQTNKDLIWEITQQANTHRTIDFLKRFESSLCLLSTTAAQLYSNYTIVPEEQNSTTMMALPNPFADYDTFNYVKNDAIAATGIRIVPAEFINTANGIDELYMVYRNKNNKTFNIPLAEGLMRLEEKYGAGQFLPIMLNKDLHHIKNYIPAMHLHRLKLDKLENLSSFERQDIQFTIAEKIDHLVA